MIMLASHWPLLVRLGRVWVHMTVQATVTARTAFVPTLEPLAQRLTVLQPEILILVMLVGQSFFLLTLSLTLK